MTLNDLPDDTLYTNPDNVQVQTRFIVERYRDEAAILAAVTLGFSEMPVTWRRQTRAEIERLMASTDLRQQLESFGMWHYWVSGERGRKAP